MLNDFSKKILFEPDPNFRRTVMMNSTKGNQLFEESSAGGSSTADNEERPAEESNWG